MMAMIEVQEENGFIAIWVTGRRGSFTSRQRLFDVHLVDSYYVVTSSRTMKPEAVCACSMDALCDWAKQWMEKCREKSA